MASLRSRVMLWAVLLFAVAATVHVALAARTSLATDLAAIAAATATIVLAVVNLEVLQQMQHAQRSAFVPTLVVEIDNLADSGNRRYLAYTDAADDGRACPPLCLRNAGPGVAIGIRLLQWLGRPVTLWAAPSTLAPGTEYSVLMLGPDGSPAAVRNGSLVLEYRDLQGRAYRCQADVHEVPAEAGGRWFVVSQVQYEAPREA